MSGGGGKKRLGEQSKTPDEGKLQSVAIEALSKIREYEAQLSIALTS